MTRTSDMEEKATNPSTKQQDDHTMHKRKRDPRDVGRKYSKLRRLATSDGVVTTSDGIDTQSSSTAKDKGESDAADAERAST